MIRPAIFIVIVAILLQGCISKHSGGMVDAEKKWPPGVASRYEIVSKWGNPDAVEDDVWIWKESRLRGGKVRASYYMIGLTVARNNIVTREHRLRFDSKGKLISHRIVSAGAEDAEWALLPWGD